MAAIPAGLRFIERVSHFEPEVELVARCHLTIERDRYLQDHVYNGMYIVPTVLALEMVAQAAQALAGDAEPVCRLEAVEMPYPIVVDPAHGLEIELRAEAQELDTGWCEKGERVRLDRAVGLQDLRAVRHGGVRNTG